MHSLISVLDQLLNERLFLAFVVKYLDIKERTSVLVGLFAVVIIYDVLTFPDVGHLIVGFHSRIGS